MIKAKGEVDGKELLIIGVSESNVQKLKEGIIISIEEKEFFNGQIVIFYGKTDKELVKEMLPIIDKGTTIYEQKNPH